MQKVPGVTSVRVSLNEGLTVLELAPSNAITLSSLRQVIRNNGFVTKEGKITARGLFLESGGQTLFEVIGSRERMTVTERTAPAADVVISGTVDLSDPKNIRFAVLDAKTP